MRIRAGDRIEDRRTDSRGRFRGDKRRSTSARLQLGAEHVHAIRPKDARRHGGNFQRRQYATDVDAFARGHALKRSRLDVPPLL